MNQAITREDYSNKGLGWYPGWRVRLSAGAHAFSLTAPSGSPVLLLDAICVQKE